ncbi:MAG: hypothetical protein JXR63_04510 [Spirochaetales bacterium]|nr:hypothetical protein [Spirochaetales bacterium]
MSKAIKALKGKLNYIYRDESVTLQNKALALFFVMMASLVIFPVGVILNLVEHDYLASGGIALILFCIFLTLVLLFAGKLKFASTFILICSLGLGAVVVFLSKDSQATISETFSIYDGMRLAVYMVPTVFAAALFGRSVWELLSLYSISVASMILVLFVRVLPAAQGDIGLAVGKVVPSIILLSICYFFANYIISSNRKILKVVESSREDAISRVGMLAKVIDSAKSGINIGSHLKKSAERSAGISRDLDDSMKRIADIYSDLLGYVKNAEESFTNLNAITDSVKSDVHSQSSAVSQSSAAVEEMTASIRQMSSTAQSRKSMVSQLIDVEQEGLNKIKTLFSAFESVQSSAEEMLNVVKVISDVAGRTNLLAMNASIEAAHAGDAGKGFSVVAQEIRNLAEETNKNSRIIKDIIKKNNDEVDSVLLMNKDSLQLFEIISEKIKELSVSMNEIFGGLVELSEGTSEINGAVENLLNLNSTVNESVSNMISYIGEGSKNIDNISRSSEDIRVEFSAIAEKSKIMSEESYNMEKIGSENVEHIKMLEGELDKLK